MFKNINKEEYLEMIQQPDVLAIDVRSDEECAAFQFPNSMQGFCWNSGAFYDRLDELDKEKKIILLCRSGSRSMQACLFLASNGFEHLYNLEGGLLAWQN